MAVSFLEVEIKALRRNILTIKKHTATRLCLPVKANAYGHGLELVVKSTKDIVDFYAVACAKEALETYKFAPDVPILTFGIVDKSFIKKLVKRQIRFSVHDYEDIQKLEKYAKKLSKKIKVHIFINTGMNMLGVEYSQAKKTIQKVFDLQYIELEGVYSHLACADQKEHYFNQLQIKRFREIVEYSRSLDNSIICHLANSYGCIGQQNISFDMVRPGILSYGFLPKFEVEDNLKCIKPIARLVTPIIKVSRLSEMKKVGYSVIYEGKKNEYIAILPVGYGDGFPRELGDSNGVVYVKNIAYPIVGRINMDALAISLGINKYEIKAGDTAELISNLQARKNSSKKLAETLNTIEYDIITSVTSRIVRKSV